MNEFQFNSNQSAHKYSSLVSVIREHRGESFHSKGTESSRRREVCWDEVGSDRNSEVSLNLIMLTGDRTHRWVSGG